MQTNNVWKAKGRGGKVTPNIGALIADTKQSSSNYSQGRGRRSNTKLPTNSANNPTLMNTSVNNSLNTRTLELNQRKADLVKRVSCQQVCSLIFFLFGDTEQGKVENLVTLFDLGFGGVLLVDIIEHTFKYQLGATDRVLNKASYQAMGLKYDLLILLVGWIHTFITNSTIEFPENIKIISFNILSHVQTKLDGLGAHYLNSTTNWDRKIKDTISTQKNLLRDLFKEPILPDKFDDFGNNFENWNYHFNELRIPENKGAQLIEYLSKNARIGRGSGYSTITVIDLSTSGKTYSMFQLANSVPTGKDYDSFFVLPINHETILFQNLVQMCDKYSMGDLVSLFILTIHVTLKTLIESVQSLSPVNFLRFVRNGGDVIMGSIFETLAEKKNGSHIEIDSLNVQISRFIKEARIKLVFCFDEAQVLLDHMDNKKQPLFKHFYKKLKPLNNPVFLGTTFTISKVEMNVSTEGRRFIRPIIGSMDPWFLEDVGKCLSYMFNVETLKENYSFSMICYLLSGSPDNVSRFHIALLNLSKQNEIQLDCSLINKALEEVVRFKEERCLNRLKSFIQDESLINRLEHLFTLLFGFECKFEDPSLNMEQLIETPMTFSQAFIEKSISFVVKKNSKSFEIVDPIVEKSYFKEVLTEFKEEIWDFLAKTLQKNGKGFEYFIITLLLFETERLEDQPISESPLFQIISKSDKCTLGMLYSNAKTFLQDRYLSSKMLRDNQEILDVWYSQLAFKYFGDTFIKPDCLVGPDGMFYLRDENNKFKLVTCAMSLVSDPVSDSNQPNKAQQMLQTLLSENIETTNKHVEENTLKESYFGWIVALNLEANHFSSTSLEILFTGSSQIVECIEKFKGEKYYDNMAKLWRKFQVD